MNQDDLPEVWRVSDPTCGLFAVAHESEIPCLISEHFGNQHPHVPLPIEGVHFTRVTTGYRCDACGRRCEPPSWFHHAEPHIDTEKILDVDGIWLLCDTCHDLFTERKLAAWTRYVWLQLAAVSPWLAVGGDRGVTVRVELVARLRSMFERFDGGRRLGLGHLPPTAHYGGPG